jgi:ABC-type branched-subunit amino acid transport system substrate-binding protein
MTTLVCWPVAAQNKVVYDAQAEQSFKKAITFYENKDYPSASQMFEKVAKRKPIHHRSSAAYLMGGRAHIKSNNPKAAIELLKPFFIRFPSSKYQSEAILLLADAYTAYGNFSEAFKGFSIGLSVTTDRDQREDFLVHLEVMFEQARFTEGQFNGLLQRVDDEIARGEIIAIWSRMEPGTGRRVERKKREVRKQAGKSFAVVLPGTYQTEMHKSIVHDISAGINAALAVHEQASGCRVDTIIYWVHSADSLRMTIKNIQEDLSILGIIGGAFSDDARSLVKATAGTDIPVVLPTATAEDLAAGNEVFQLNVPFSIRGKILADYVKNNMKARTVAILAPLRSFARTIAEAFKQQARKIGLQVDVVSWYRPGTDEMARQFHTLKTRQFTDSIDVLFAPVESPEDIPPILQGVAESGVTRNILGAGDWNHPDTIAAHIKSHIRVEFATEFAIDSSRSDYKSFATYYRKNTGRYPSKHAVFGYDAAGFLLRSLCANPKSRESVIEELYKPYNALRSQISISPFRQNTGLTIMRYSKGSVREITTIQETFK